MVITLVTLAWAFALLIVAAAVARYLDRQQVQRRVFESAFADDAAALDAASQSGLARWLVLAGYRGAGAGSGFIAAMFGALALGATFGYAVWATGLMALADKEIANIPGGFSDLMRSILVGLPWMAFVLVGCLPFMAVRRARRRRVAQVERDLPITLELLATLAEAGLGFDAALDRILASQPADRALVEEFRTFQAEALAGRPRVDCLRRVARRLEVTAVTIFISSMVQAEQIGSGVAEVLRHQSDDLRQRRRERAIEYSMSLPVKLLFPLVICFLPGILVFAIGPAFYEFFRLVDSYSHNHHHTLQL
jgi:tight adherence protein C